MNDFMIKLKRIFVNKNSVTIIGVVLVLILLYVGYTSQINSAVDPISVPTANKKIEARTQITSDMIDVIDVPSISVDTSLVYTSKSSVVGKYVNVSAAISKGSMFFKDAIVTKDELPDSAFVKVKNGDVVYNLPVDMDSTYGNSIYPGNKIDIYLKAVDGGKIMVGKLVANIEVLAVKDKDGNHVFETTEESRTPAMLIFGVSEEINILLRKATYMDDYDAVLIPVPHGGTVKSTGDTEVSSQYIKDFINSKTVDLPAETTTTTDSTSTTKSSTSSKSTSSKSTSSKSTSSKSTSSSTSSES